MLGASVRAAAWSVLRSGALQPRALDLYADADLQRSCPAQAIPAFDYPRGLIEAARQAPPGPWLYTGALENHPTILDAIARDRPLWGIPGAIVRKVRAPLLLAEALRQGDLRSPAVWKSVPAAGDRRWLLKPCKSAGGAYIRPWQGQPIKRSFYLQEWIEGDACSAQYAGFADDGARFLGATRQLIGVPWLHAADFRYCGNLGPLPINGPLRSALEKVGNVLTSAFSLRGLFGVDFILQDNVPWPVEVNPRYTAALEILERAGGQSLFHHHQAAFSTASAPTPSAAPACAPGVWGKAILFARAPLVFSQQGPWLTSLEQSWQGNPDYADIPAPGTHIERDQPIMTLFAQGSGEAECVQRLREKAQALDACLFGC